MNNFKIMLFFQTPRLCGCARDAGGQRPGPSGLHLGPALLIFVLCLRRRRERPSHLHQVGGIFLQALQLRLESSCKLDRAPTTAQAPLLRLLLGRGARLRQAADRRQQQQRRASDVPAQLAPGAVERARKEEQVDVGTRESTAAAGDVESAGEAVYPTKLLEN